MDRWLKYLIYLICFILGYLLCTMMGNGFEVDNQDDELLKDFNNNIYYEFKFGKLEDINKYILNENEYDDIINTDLKDTMYYVYLNFPYGFDYNSSILPPNLFSTDNIIKYLDDNDELIKNPDTSLFIVLYKNFLQMNENMFGNNTNIHGIYLDTNDEDNKINIPKLSGLTNLNYLRISNIGNKFETIDVSSLTNLNYLNLSSNQLTNVSGLGRLTNLNHLELNDNRLTTINVSGLTRLNHLNLSPNRLTNVSGLGRLTNLNYLYLGDNQLTTINVSGLTNLKNLDVSNYLETSTNSMFNVEDLNASGLEELYIANMGIKKDMFQILVNKLINYKNFNTLYIGMNNPDILNGSGLGHLTGLKELGLQYLNLSDKSDFSFLNRLTNLKELYLNNNGKFVDNKNNLTKIPNVVKSLKNLKELFMPGELECMDNEFLSELEIGDNYYFDNKKLINDYFDKCMCPNNCSNKKGEPLKNAFDLLQSNNGCRNIRDIYNMLDIEDKGICYDKTNEKYDNTNEEQCIENKNWCNYNKPSPIPTPTPSNEPIYCNPNAIPKQLCPDGTPCPNCNSDSCLCPT